MKVRTKQDRPLTADELNERKTLCLKRQFMRIFFPIRIRMPKPRMPERHKFELCGFWKGGIFYQMFPFTVCQPKTKQQYRDSCAVSLRNIRKSIGR